MLGQVKIIPGLAQQLAKQVREKQKKAFFENLSEPYKPAENLPGCVIIDVDGTLAIRTNRGPYDYDKVGQDDVCSQVRFITNIIKRDKQLIVIVVSGREDKYLKITEDWLKKYEIQYDHIFMRLTGDHRPDYIVKKEIFDNKIRNKYAVFFAVEDRKQVKKMWVGLGIFVFDCNQKDEVY